MQLAVLGSAILYWWPDEDWQVGPLLGRVRRHTGSSKVPFTHVVRYRYATVGFAGDVDSLLAPGRGLVP